MADSKVTALTDIGTVASSDLLYVVDDPGGTPSSKKATVLQVGNALGANGPAFVTPVNGDFSWVNQGSASVSVSSVTGNIYLSSPGTGASPADNVRMRVKSAPSTPYTLTAAVIPNVVMVDYHGAGILFRESGTGKVRKLSYGYNSASPSGAMRMRVYGFNDATTYSGFTSTLTMIPTPGLMWLRLTNDGTDLTFQYSVDGENFRTILTEAKTTGFTTAPDQIGFAVNSGGDPSNDTGITLVSWRES